MTTWRILRACAHREAVALRHHPVAVWPHITADRHAHVALCAAHGRYVPVADPDVPDARTLAERDRWARSKRKVRAA